MFFGVIIVGLAILAKTGVVQIPVFSEIFYKHPEPSRIIKIDDDQKGFEIEVNAQLQNLEISEQQLTYFLKQLLTRGEDPYFAQNIQATISVDGIEVFGFLQKPLRTNLTLMVRPYISTGKLNLEVIKVVAGNLSVPPALFGWLTKDFLADILDELNQKLETFGDLEKIELYLGKLVIDFQLLD